VPAQFAVLDYFVPEGAPEAVVTVERPAASSSEYELVIYQVNDGTAVAPWDYVPTFGIVEFQPGETSKTFTVSLVQDNTDEPDETIQLTLLDPADDTLVWAGSTATLTILDATPSPTIDFANTSLTVHEVEGTARLTVSLNYADTDVVEVAYTLAGGTATAGSDFDATGGTVVFQPGETERTIEIPVYALEGLGEAAEQFTVTLHDPVNAALGPGAAATVTIEDEAVGNAGTHAEVTLVPVGNEYIVVYQAVPGQTNSVQVGWQLGMLFVRDARRSLSTLTARRSTTPFSSGQCGVIR
jgi:hypothetical protein